MSHPTVTLSGLDMALTSLRTLLRAHGPACVCSACQALVHGTRELDALDLLVSVLHARARLRNDVEAQEYLCILEKELRV
jgi:hypothetical protein